MSRRLSNSSSSESWVALLKTTSLLYFETVHSESDLSSRRRQKHLSASSRSSAFWMIALRCFAYAEFAGSNSSTCKVCFSAARFTSVSSLVVSAVVVLGRTFKGLLAFKLRFPAALLRDRSSEAICCASLSVSMCKSTESACPANHSIFGADRSAATEKLYRSKKCDRLSE